MNVIYDLWYIIMKTIDLEIEGQKNLEIENKGGRSRNS